MNERRITRNPATDNNEPFAEHLADELNVEGRKTLDWLGDAVAGLSGLSEQMEVGARTPLDVAAALEFVAKLKMVAEAAQRIAGECHREAGKWKMMAIVANEMPCSVLRGRGF